MKASAEMRGDQRKGKREREGKEQKKASKRQMPERWREDEGQRGEQCDSKGQREAVKVAKQAAETRT